MNESEQGATAVELLLREPEIVAWLEDYRSDERPSVTNETGSDDDPPAAA